jgi:hypothetical protein
MKNAGAALSARRPWQLPPVSGKMAIIADAVLDLAGMLVGPDRREDFHKECGGLRSGLECHVNHGANAFLRDSVAHCESASVPARGRCEASVR